MAAQTRESKVGHLVVDSAAFIRNAPIERIGSKVYCVRDVVNEIRDKATRERLQVLPYDIIFREPSSESIAAVSEFAKKTGDYRSLSAVDIRLLALSFQLHKENIGLEHVRTEPCRKITWVGSKKAVDNTSRIAGFYIAKTGAQSVGSDKTSETISKQSPTDNKARESTSVSLTENDALPGNDAEPRENDALPGNDAEPRENDALPRSDVAPHAGEDSCTGAVDAQADVGDSRISDSMTGSTTCTSSDGIVEISPSDIDVQSEHVTAGLRDVSLENVHLAVTELEEDDADSGTESNDSNCDDNKADAEDDKIGANDENDEDGWITPSNISSAKAAMGAINTSSGAVQVACLTVDFAMQNVLIQMGLNVVSVDGLLIKRARSYVLRCFACFKVTSDTTRQFCHHCGNKTLQKVSVTVNSDGSVKYFLCTRRVNTRGMKFSLPQPQGGKHACNPRLVEDQPGAHQRVAGVSHIKYDVFDPDYVAHSSPFAPVDVHSRAAHVGFNQRGSNAFRNKRNPNEVKKNYGRRK